MLKKSVKLGKKFELEEALKRLDSDLKLMVSRQSFDITRKSAGLILRFFEYKEKEVAMSDYLTDGEWDACFYASMGKHADVNFGASMHRSIDVLIKNGYKFEGLDERGSKKQQVPSGNPHKVCIWLGNPYKVDLLEVLDNGRNFWKSHFSSIVDETDEEWAEQMAKARAEQSKPEASTPPRD